MSGISAKAVAALQEIRNQLRFDDHVDLEAFRDSFNILDQAGVFDEVDRWERLNGWIPLPHGVTGTQIRHRKIIGNNVRLGGGEPKVIVAETDEWVIYAVHSGGRNSRFITENAVRKEQFENEFERKE